MHGEAVAEGELVELAPFRPAHRVLFAGEERLVRQDAGFALAFVVREQQRILAVGAAGDIRDDPNLPVQQLLAGIVAQANHAVADHRLVEGQAA